MSCAPLTQYLEVACGGHLANGIHDVASIPPQYHHLGTDGLLCWPPGTRPMFSFGTPQRPPCHVFNQGQPYFNYLPYLSSLGNLEVGYTVNTMTVTICTVSFHQCCAATGLQTRGVTSENWPCRLLVPYFAPESLLECRPTYTARSSAGDLASKT